MSQRFINQLGERESIDQIFLACDKQLRTNRNGNLYLQMRLADRTGAVNAMMWNASDSVGRVFDNGDYVRVEGTTQFYNGALQIIANRIERAEPGDINEEDFIQLSNADIDGLTKRLMEILRGLGNYHLRNLAECFLMDDEFMSRFVRAPAAVKNHHAYLGGLLEHVVQLLEVVLSVAPNYPELDTDVLVMGAFLHDIGKIEELSYDRDLAYTDEGQLIGHVVMGVGMLDNKLQEAAKLADEAMPTELALRLKHMIVSHHGQYDFGSPKLPMTIEAVALHLLDNLDAKIRNYDLLIREDVNQDSHWTPYHANLGRKLFKGSGNTSQ